MRRQKKNRLSSLLGGVVLSLLVMSTGFGAMSAHGREVFQGFTTHINQQIVMDKQKFVEAQSCTEWFYKHQKHKKDNPGAKQTAISTVQREFDTSQCSSLFPEGLEEVRAAFSQTQSSLSFSLTFYEFALVGDRNDDRHYSESELRDLLESFGIAYDERLHSSVYVTLLNRKFDSTRMAGEFQVLMDSMGFLYAKGYRFTGFDQEALNQVLG